ncbi:MAG: DUF3781 domain-containing protein [Patescibacteria group bacterium]
MKTIDKAKILNNICYTDLVYGRINKKLEIFFSREKIEEYIFRILDEAEIECFSKIGKNFYVTSQKHGVRVTINSNTFRIITVDKVN